MLGKYKFNAQSLLSLSVLAIIAVVIVGYVLFSGGSSSSKHNYTSQLIYADTNSGQVYLTDSSGKTLSKAAIPKYSYPSSQALASNGGLLASTGTGSNSESFVFTRLNTIKTYSGDQAKLLSSAPLMQTSHQIFFTDDKSVILLSCVDQGTDCQLQKLNLATDKSSEVLDTGTKQPIKYIPNIYLVGYNSSKQLAYIRVINSKNKLGSSTNAVYEVDTAHAKVTRNFDLPVEATYTTTLSPDGSKIAYTSTDKNNKKIINVLNLDKKSHLQTNWDKGLLATGPGTLNWSPDSTKILLHSINITTADKTPQPVVVAYVDVGDNLSVHAVTQLTDPTHQSVFSLGWLDNQHIVYQVKKSATPNSLLNATNQTLTQAISGDSASPLKVPAGDLLQPTFY